MLIASMAFFALYGAHRQKDRTCAAFAAILSFIGTAVFLSSNVAFPMLALSREYAAATNDAQRSMIAAAGQSLLAAGEHSSPGTFMGYLFTDTAAIVMGIVILRNRIFRKLNGWTAIVGFVLLLIFNFCAAFIPAIYDTSLVFAGIGGVLFIVTYVLIALRLLKLGRAGTQQRQPFLFFGGRRQNIWLETIYLRILPHERLTP